MLTQVPRQCRSFEEDQDYSPQWRHRQATAYYTAMLTEIEANTGCAPTQETIRSFLSHVEFPAWEDDDLVKAYFHHMAGAVSSSRRWSTTFKYVTKIIDGNGRHLAYVGPYDLMDKNYAETFWFKEVMDRGIYISDMFMGFRKIPHFVIAVVRRGDGGPWILRATIDTDSFRSLVENVKIGNTGEVYLVNRNGAYQTTSRFGGSIMSPSGTAVGTPHEDIRIRVENSHLNGNGQRIPRQVVCQTWLKDPKWMLVVKQDYA